MSENTDTDGADVPKNEWDLVKIIYLLYAVGLVTAGGASLIGVILAHVKSGNVSPVIQSHLDYQIRTFWYAVVIVIVGILTIVVGIGILLLLVVGLWQLIRVIKGFLRANDGEAVENPLTWFV